MSEELKPCVQMLDEQDETGVTTYSVVIDHMEHGVLLHSGQDRERAEEIRFVVQHELDRAWNRRAGEGAVDWRCDNCGDAYPDGPGSWRHGFHGPEHKCDGVHAQAGHMAASYVGDEVTRSAIAQMKRDLARTCMDLSNVLAQRDALAARVEELEGVLKRIAAITPKPEHGPEYVAGQIGGITTAADQAIGKP